MTSLINFLAYGAIGLGLALAILAYLLLRKEQDMKAPRREIIQAIYVFMCFAIVLSIGGFTGEFLKSDAETIDEVKAQLVKKTEELEQAEERFREVEGQLSTSRALIRSLLSLKGGKLDRLKRLDPHAPEYTTMVREIRRDLEAIDQRLESALR